MLIIIHPQGVVRDASESEVDAFLALGWELAPEQPEPQPSMSWLREDIITYARDRGVELDARSTKRELLDALHLHPPAVAGEE